jgi:glycosyltransferase involved in cell wall biosynthesis
MKILHVTQSLGRGGAERLVLEIGQAIQRMQLDVQMKIVALAELNEYPELSENLDITYCNSYVRLSLTGKSQIEVGEFEKIVDEFQPDIIHSHTYIAELVSRENPRKGIKYFTHVHSDFAEFEHFPLKSILNKKSWTNLFEKQRLFRRFNKVNNQFITISAAIDENLRCQLGDKWTKNIHLLHNAIDFKKFSQKEIPEYPSRAIRLITVGRFYTHKNQIFLVDVLKYLIEIDKRFELVLIGVGPEKEKVFARGKELGVEQNITFTGLIETVELELAKSHVYVHPAKYEPFGLVLIEAMAAGLPVVCLDAGGNRDLIEQDKNGFIFPNDCPPELFAKKIIEIVENKTVFANMSKYSRAFASNYDIESYVSKLLALYAA